MRSVPSRDRPGWQIRWPMALVAAGIIVVMGWTVLCTGRSWMLWREASAAVAAARWDQAEQSLARRAWYRPNDVEGLRLRALVALKRGDTAAALAWLAAVPEASPDDSFAHFTRGEILRELFRIGEAELEYRACLRLDPGYTEAHRQLIVILGVERRAAKQEDQLWALHDEGGRPLEALRMLAQAMPVIPPGALSKTADEGMVLEQCLAADPANRHVLPALAYFLRNRGEVDRAASLLAPWLDKHSEDSEALNEYLACLIDAGEVEAACPWFEGHSDSRIGRFWRLRGEWLLMQGRRDDAVDSFRKTVSLDPRDPEARYRLGRALHADGRAAEAAEHMAWHERAQELKLLAASIADEAADTSQLVQAGRLCAEMGRTKEARGWYALVLRLDPNHSEARAALASQGDQTTPPAADKTAPRTP